MRIVQYAGYGRPLGPEEDPILIPQPSDDLPPAVKVPPIVKVSLPAEVVTMDTSGGAPPIVPEQGTSLWGPAALAIALLLL